MMAAGHTLMGGVVVIKGFGSIFYIRNVVGNDTYSIYTRMGGGMQPAVTFWETHRAKIGLYKKPTFASFL